MNTQHFKYAIEVERTRSITQAANNLYMAQPNLSKAIRELEETLGYPIFVRNNKGVSPTEKGREFLQYARNILMEQEKMEALGRKQEDAQRIAVTIPRGSYIGTAFTSFIAGLNFAESIDAKLQETNSMQVIANVLDGDFQLGVIRYQDAYENYFMDYVDSLKLKHEVIWSFEYHALMSVRNPLANAEKIYYQDLMNYIEIVHGDTLIPYLSAVEAHRPPGGEQNLPSKRICLYDRCNQFDLLAGIPETFMWASPIPREIMERYDLVQRRCHDSGQPYKDVLIHRKDYRFTALDRVFLRKLYQSKDEVASMEYR